MIDNRQHWTAYEQLLCDVNRNGEFEADRTGVGTRKVFGRQIRFDLQKGFPLITTKRIHFKSVAAELLWFLRGDSNTKWLKEQGVRIWDEWADKNGELGPVYGVQWRSWPTASGTHIDQIATLMDSLKTNPASRRHIVSAWNVAEIENMALPPCHLLFQFDITNGRLSCQLYQRSADMFLGVPFNIASYSLLTHMIAQQLDLEPGEFIWNGGNVHIYTDHERQVLEQLGRQGYPLPRLTIARKPASIFDYTLEDFVVENYQHHPAIKATVAV